MTDKRDQLQDIAQRHVQRAGLKALSFRTLAEEAGIKSSSVHYYFPEKADLTEAIIERYASVLMNDLEKISNRTNWNLRKKISAFIGIFESVAKDDAVCLCGMLAAEFGNLSEENRTQLNVVFSDMEKWLTTVFKNHKDELTISASPTHLARSVIAGLEGGLLIDRVAKNNHCVSAQKALVLSLVS